MNDKDALEILVKAIKKTKLMVNGEVTGNQETYEIITYVDVIAVEDENGVEIITLSRSDEDTSDS